MWPTVPSRFLGKRRCLGSPPAMVQKSRSTRPLYQPARATWATPVMISSTTRPRSVSHLVAGARLQRLHGIARPLRCSTAVVVSLAKRRFVVLCKPQHRVDVRSGVAMIEAVNQRLRQDGFRRNAQPLSSKRHADHRVSPIKLIRVCTAKLTDAAFGGRDQSASQPGGKPKPCITHQTIHPPGRTRGPGC